MATVSKKFVDLNPNFEKNPLTKDLPLLKNAEAIKFAVKNIVMTTRGIERFVHTSEVQLLGHYLRILPLQQQMISKLLLKMP
ncbi:MAG: hypothetical protein CM15mV5_3180 [uncultured marine virus]|nr:MAG: hypothetical protein CM15mV5_3180 [uncultured marine virus]